MRCADRSRSRQDLPGRVLVGPCRAAVAVDEVCVGGVNGKVVVSGEVRQGKLQ